MGVIFETSLGGPEATTAAARALSAVLRAGDNLGLSGDLGAGKTLFVQGLAAGLGVDSTIAVTSPTFTLVNEYPGGRELLVHADLYRVESAADLDQIGLREQCDAGEVIAAVEWWERFPSVFYEHLAIELTVVDETTRRLVVTAHGDRPGSLGLAWRRALHL